MAFIQSGTEFEKIICKKNTYNKFVESFRDRWCERRTSSEKSDEAIYSIGSWAKLD